MGKKEKTSAIPKITKISIPDFILLALFTIGPQKSCKFENLLKECYNLSPETFSFPQISQWPDARKIDRPLRTMRKKGLIKGSPESFFSLTKKGRKIAQELAKILRQKKLFKD